MVQHVRIKICGITNEADAVLAASLGADAVGLNFFAQSPRCITPEKAHAILRQLPPFVEPVALFVNEPWPAVFSTLASLSRIRTVQGYGTNRDINVEAPYQLIPAFPVKDRESLQEITDYLESCRRRRQLPAAILVDAHVAGQHGGTGQTSPWDLLAGFKPGVPLILAGGLTAENVAEAVRTVRPYAVDVASGVERTAGKKDPEKVRRFIDSARAAVAT